MSAERWQRVKVLFERALDSPPSARDDLLEESDESPSVVAEVRELISRDAGAGSFLADAGSADSSIATLLSASDLVSGHFRIVSLLGRGGMGVVYRAEDLVLSRPVALKFLPGDLGGTTQALERLKREARAAAALNHPNICVVYETGQHQGQPFIAMELLEGQTLKQSIGAKPLKTEALLDWAVQIANGLDAAHRNGIVHRDIKPANVFITRFGQVKILDFGLAKVTAPVSGEAAELSASPTEEYLTTPGMVIGTVPYMSPEQARGEALDARTDLFSFGAVLYEMATGRAAFAGATTALIHQAVLSLTPPPASTMNAGIPRELDRIIGKALEKDRDLRYQHAADMGADLKRLKRDTESGRQANPSSVAQAQKGGSHSHKLLYGFMLAMVPLALGFGWFWFKSGRSADHGLVTERQLTHTTSEKPARGGAISPDGKHLAYADTNGLHLNVIDTGEINDIPLPQEIQTELWKVNWFPDGEKLLLTFQSKTDDSEIWVKSIFGGAPRKLRTSARAAVVSPDGTLIAFTNPGGSQVWVMGANGENPKKILTSENERVGALAWSPSGQRLAYTKPKAVLYNFGGSIETVAMDGGSPSPVLSDPHLDAGSYTILRWARDGRLIFALEDSAEGSNINLWEIPTDPRTGKTTGKPAKITNWFGVSPLAASVSGDGSRLAVFKTHIRNDVYVAELTENGTRLDSPKRLTFSDSEDYPTAWTPDSKSVVFTSDRTGNTKVFKQQLDQETAEPLIQGPGNDGEAELSPDGAWFFYWTSPRGSAQQSLLKLMRISSSGGSPEQVLEAPDQASPNFQCPSGPGGFCVFSRADQGHMSFYELDPLKGLGKEVGRIEGPAGPAFGVSPDGTHVAVPSKGQIHILNSQNGTDRVFQLPQGWYIYSLQWVADGAALFAAVQSTEGLIARIELDGKTRVLLDQGRNHVLNFALPSPDGRRLTFMQRTSESNFWLLENF
jgi:serine/threonine protein kinase/dipeptidyl aminopeptidase/acylaminoacyl peptidase